MCEAIDEKDSNKLSQVIMENSRTMSMDKVTTKLLSETKNIHCADRAAPELAQDSGN